MVGDMGLWCVCAHCAMQVMSVTSECSVGCPTTGGGGDGKPAFMSATEVM